MQEDIINAVLEGKDVLALLPTGGGKSVCFQVPALATDGICIVISPLIALMKDQVQQLKRRGILALSIYSGMNFIEVKKTLQNAAHGNYKFLYVSPERLETSLFLEYLPAMNVNLIAVDEAHCISQWGYDFRPPYTRIAALREHLPNVPVIALTASATAIVQYDICEKLSFSKNQQRFRQSFERSNLSYSVFNVPAKQHKLLEILNNVKGSAIVYCKSRKRCKDIAELLLLNKINAGFYHAGLSNDDRNKRQESWINNETRVMVCTNAFGMGIDKPDVRTVVHYDTPDCLENYYQEAGRAGRDGKRSYAVLLYSDRELEDLQQQTDTRYPAREIIKQVYTAVMNHLQIAAGGGAGFSYDFDISAFSTAFKFNILTATYALKTLEQEEILSYNDVFFKPSTLVFTCDRAQLQTFEKEHPALDPLIKGLLRSYEGIFDFPATISESALSSFIKKAKPTIENDLLQLKRFGIADYQPQKEKPQVTLLQNRMYADSFVINLDDYQKRKEKFAERVEAMISYVKNTNDCRGKMIGRYFTDDTVRPCGICDNCINNNVAPVSSGEFESITQHIYTVIGDKHIPPQYLTDSSKHIKKEKLWTVLNYLQAEKKIRINKEGEISR